MLKETNNTIVALSTPLGSGAICVVRMSGEDAIKIADKLFANSKGKKPSEFVSRMMELGEFKADGFCEQILCVVFRAPNSFTGENLVEFQCHGGIRIADGIIKSCISHGATMATAGEFSKRAFINGKMSLEKAEGMMDMINAESEAEIRAGYDLLKGKVGKETIWAQNKLVDLLSEVEVSFDYPEEDIEYVTKEKVQKVASEIIAKLNTLIETSEVGKQIKDGISLLILGEPNVGKSSLLNALTQTSRAIVTDIAGTTRDTIEETLLIDGVKFKIIDTAGIHKTEDVVENLGIERAKDLINSVDLCLCLVDCSKKRNEKDEEVLALTNNVSRIVVGNKKDLAKEPKQVADIYISTADEKSINELKKKIIKTTVKQNISSGVVITNARHLDALKRAKKHLEKALSSLKDGASLDLVSIDLNLAYSALGEITGNTSGEDIISSIFAKFCLGK
ncbi:MAG: tRNA uridine-5-carboxymethylaminomethyl(34) synthesis GTPase MnmE [Clostridia bacterium]|nr:tRNA uridine-5-carboxymethylaminomethyl(34) synthesis GTPase MnmE [Clostridia bacterium]